MLLGMLSISCLAYPFIVQVEASDKCLGWMQHREQYGNDRVGCTKRWMPGAEVLDSGSYFLLLGREPMEEKFEGRHRQKGKDMYRALDGKIGRCCCRLYLLLSLTS